MFAGRTGGHNYPMAGRGAEVFGQRMQCRGKIRRHRNPDLGCFCRRQNHQEQYKLQQSQGAHEHDFRNTLDAEFSPLPSPASRTHGVVFPSLNNFCR
jgi:hypothetical protein